MTVAQITALPTRHAGRPLLHDFLTLSGGFLGVSGAFFRPGGKQELTLAAAATATRSGFLAATLASRRVLRAALRAPPAGWGKSLGGPPVRAPLPPAPRRIRPPASALLARLRRRSGGWRDGWACCLG